MHRGSFPRLKALPAAYLLHQPDGWTGAVLPLIPSVVIIYIE